MVILLIGLCVAAAIMTQGTAVFTVAVINAILSVWGNGVLANYSFAERHLAPNWAAGVSLLTTIAGIVFLVISLSS